MQPLGAPAEAEPPPPMLFEEQGGAEESVEISNQLRSAVPGAPRFRITSKRMIEYGTSPGCHACETFTNTGHTSECRERFRRLLTESGELKGHASSLEGEAPPDFLQPSAESVSVQVREDAKQMESLFGEQEAVPPIGVENINTPGKEINERTPFDLGTPSFCNWTRAAKEDSLADDKKMRKTRSHIKKEERKLLHNIQVGNYR